MSWTELTGGTEVLVSDAPLESARFGLTFARVSVPDRAEPATACDQVVRTLTEHEADVIVLRYPARWADWHARLLGPGRDLLHADTLVYWSYELAGREPVGTGPYRLDAAPLPSEIAPLVAAAFDGYTNHYRANPLLDPAAIRAGFAEWGMRVTAAGGGFVLREDGGRPAGFGIIAPQGETVEWVLAGLREDLRGAGRYRHVIDAVLDLALERGAHRVVTSTQAHYAAGQRPWARAGFLPDRAFETVHAVRSGLLSV